MNTQELSPTDFFDLYTQTVSALVVMNQDAMMEVMKKTDPAFSLFCMEEMVSRLAAAIMSQKNDPEGSVAKFTEELNNKLQMCLSQGVMQ